jgi:S1-C subfamily serine protease
LRSDSNTIDSPDETGATTFRYRPTVTPNRGTRVNAFKGSIARLAFTLTLATLLSPISATCKPQDSKTRSLNADSRARVRQAIAAVGLVMVRRRDEPAGSALRPRGSAVIVRGNGTVVTNYHVILDDRSKQLYDDVYLALTVDGVPSSLPSRRYRLVPVVISKEYDLALLRAVADGDGNPIADSFVFPAVEIGDSQNLQLLEDLTVIGFPEKGGSTVTVNSGVVEGKDVLGNWIKTDARVIHGNSGGAAVNADGKLIGIPTKVVADVQPVDRNGDGFPDAYRTYGAVGFLRPSHLVAELLAQLGERKPDPNVPAAAPAVVSPPTARILKGSVKSSVDGKPVAGALIGLVPVGSTTISEANLLTWGSTNTEGVFTLGKPVPPGKYSLRVRAFGYDSYAQDISVDEVSASLDIQLTRTEKKR